MAEYLIKDTTLTDIADAIREKLEITDTMTPEQMPEYIRSIENAQYAISYIGYVYDNVVNDAWELVDIQSPIDQYNPISVSNKPSSIRSGASFVTSVDTAEDRITSIEITMGDAVISNCATINGDTAIIHIEKVTGDLTITIYARSTAT
jgi:hypothetical protein